MKEVSAEHWPSVERAGPFECWLLDDLSGARIRRVCGAQKVLQRRGRVCLKPAGHGTAHPGLGMCRAHEPSGAEKAQMYRAISLELPGLPDDHPMKKAVHAVYARMQRTNLQLPYEELASLYVYKHLLLEHYTEVGHLTTDDSRTLLAALGQLRAVDRDIARVKDQLHKAIKIETIMTREEFAWRMNILRDVIIRLVADRDTRNMLFAAITQDVLADNSTEQWNLRIGTDAEDAESEEVEGVDGSNIA